MKTLLDLTEPNLLTHAMDAYLEAGQPAQVCPRCGYWQEEKLPSCTDPGWTHTTACSRIRYALDVCDECAKDMDIELKPV